MTTADRTARKAYAAGQWVDLRDRLQTVTPQAIGRAIVAVAATAGAVALTRRLVAGAPRRSSSAASSTYELLPVVDALDRVMPRMLAAILSVLAVVAAIVAIGDPRPAAAGERRSSATPRTSRRRPTSTQRVARFQQQLATLPDGSDGGPRSPVLTSLASTVREAFSSATGGLDDIVRTGLAVLLNAVGALPRPDRPADLDARAPDPEAPGPDRGRQPDHAVAATGRLGGGLDRRSGGRVLPPRLRRDGGPGGAARLRRDSSSRRGSAARRSSSRWRSRRSPA